MGELSSQVNDDLASISLVFVTFWRKCTYPVDRVVEASVLKANVLDQKHSAMSPQQHVVP